jgi:ABC-type nitrate/sulfonate/bicarbonate transport system permease component
VSAASDVQERATVVRDEPIPPDGSARRRPRPVNRGLRALRRATSNWLGVVAALALWEALPRLGVLPAEYIPPVSEVGARLVEVLGQGTFWQDVGSTLAGWAVGLGIAIGAAVPLGLLIGSNAYLHRATRATVEFLRPIPSVALIPLAVLVFGITFDMKIFLVAFASFWPILVQAIYGVQDVDPVARDTARSFGLGRTSIFCRVTLPSAAPYIATGVRISSALAIILAITAELVAGVPGLGHSILLAQNGGATELMYALIVATGLLSLWLSAGIAALERHVLRWHQSHREIQTT